MAYLQDSDIDDYPQIPCILTPSSLIQHFRAQQQPDLLNVTSTYTNANPIFCLQPSHRASVNPSTSTTTYPCRSITPNKYDKHCCICCPSHEHLGHGSFTNGCNGRDEQCRSNEDDCEVDSRGLRQVEKDYRDEKHGDGEDGCKGPRDRPDERIWNSDDI